MLCQGSAAGGYSLFMQNGRLAFVHNYVERDYFKVESAGAVPPGHHELRFEFEPTGAPDMPNGKGAPARLQLYIDGELVGETDAPHTTPMMFNPGALACGSNPGSPIALDYGSPFAFTGTIHTVTVDVSGELITDPEAEIRMHLARQ